VGMPNDVTRGRGHEKMEEKKKWLKEKGKWKLKITNAEEVKIRKMCNERSKYLYHTRT
jgi:hypothetical protein